MLVWNFLTARSVSQARAELAQERSRHAEAEGASREFEKAKKAVVELQNKANTIRQIDSRIDVAGVLGELSFLIDEKIVLRSVMFSAERFGHNQREKSETGNAVRVVGGGRGRRKAPLLGDVRFRVVLSGVASEASDVAELICKLEDSSYFCQVIPSFSRNTEVKCGTVRANKNLRASEFEISCYLANYRQEDLQYGSPAAVKSKS
jgi:hypothetical protein